MFIGSIGMLMFFMLGGAFRAAGDARTPLRLGLAMTVLNFCLNVVFISGAGPIPAFGTRGAAMGTVIASTHRRRPSRVWMLCTGRLGRALLDGDVAGGRTSRSFDRFSASACRPGSREWR